jgi:hypothetical protein
VTTSAQPCDYADSAGSEVCGRTPTTLVALGMDTPRVGPNHRESGESGDFRYAHYCDEHLSLVRDQLNRGGV